ncbi:MAG: 6-carboxytetrahydropterin synthase [Thermaerobacter sp.]|nr:6-carboxytetrahydropterin synthase [Thermaerobacter sp.]
MKLSLLGKEAGLGFQSVHLVPGRGMCSRLHPHFHTVSVTLEGEPSERGMLVHIYRLKEVVQRLCLDLDHMVLLADYPPEVMTVEEQDSGYRVHVNGKDYFLPRSDVLRLPIRTLNVEDLCQHLAESLRDRLEPILDKRRIVSLTVDVDEGDGQTASVTLPIAR